MRHTTWTKLTSCAQAKRTVAAKLHSSTPVLMVCSLNSYFKTIIAAKFHAASVGNVTITELHSKPKYPVLGESAILICNASMRSSLGYIQWTHEAETFYPIYEDPFCNSRDSAVRNINMHSVIVYEYC